MHLYMRVCMVCWLFSQSMFTYAQRSDSLCVGACCCDTDPAPPAGIMMSHIHQKGEWMVSYRYMTMSMHGVMEGSSKISNADVFSQPNNYVMSPQTMRMDMHMLMLMYGLTNRITLMAMLNYNYTTMTMVPFVAAMPAMPGMPAGQTMNPVMQTQGIGDLKISAMYGILNTRNHQLLVNGGLSIPTGSANLMGGANSGYDNTRLSYTMQLGSGTWDLWPLINYIYKYNRLSLSAQLQSIIRLGYNTVGYNLGNQYTGNLWAGYRWLQSWGSTLRLEAINSSGINGSDPDLYTLTEPSANYLNYGGTRISTYIGTSYRVTQGALKNNTLSAEVGIPIYQNYNGVQMANTWSLFATWTYMFHNPFESKHKHI